MKIIPCTLFRAISLAVAASVLFCSCSKDPLDEPEESQTIAGNDNAGSTIDTDASDDYISKTTFAKTVSVVFSTSGNASVSNASDLDVKVSGNDVTITNNGTSVVMYELSGTTTDGFFKLYSSVKQGITLKGVSIINKGGAAINNQSHKRTFIVLEGSSTLTDCAVNSSGDYPDETSSEDMKAAFFSEGQLVFSGSGSLTVNAVGKAGITSDDYVRVMDGPSISVTASSGHGVRGKEAVIVSGGTIDVSVSGTGKKGFSADSVVFIGGGKTTITTTGSAGKVDGEMKAVAGVKADGRFKMTDGELTVTSSGQGAKGVSCDNVGYISGGKIDIRVSGSNYGTSSNNGGFGPGGMGRPGSSSSSSNDNYSSAKGMKFDGNLYISGGDIYAYAAKHEAIEAKGVIEISGGIVHGYSPADDAINSGGDMTITGGYVCGHSSGNDGLDANGNVFLKGGVVYAIGTTTPEVGIDANTEEGYKLYLPGGTIIAIAGLENGSSISQALVAPSSWKKSTDYALFDGDTPLITFKTPSAGGTALVLSCGSMKSGSKYGLSSGVTVSGGKSYFGGLYTEGASVSGGTKTTLTASTSYSGNGGPGGGGFGW